MRIFIFLQYLCRRVFFLFLFSCFLLLFIFLFFFFFFFAIGTIAARLPVNSLEASKVFWRTNRKIKIICVCLYVCVYMCVCVCVWEREGEKERERGRNGDRERGTEIVPLSRPYYLFRNMLGPIIISTWRSQLKSWETLWIPGVLNYNIIWHNI